MWRHEWNKAFETRNPEIVTRVLEEILATVHASTDIVEKAWALLAVSTCYAILGNDEQSRLALDEANGMAPADDTIFQAHLGFQKAMCHNRAGQLEESLVMLTRLLAQYAEELKNPKVHYLFEQIQFSRGITMASLAQFAEAKPLLEEAKSFDLVDGDRSILCFHLGTCYFALDNNASALHYFLEARRLGVVTEWKGMWHYYVGRIYYRLKDYARAKQEFLEAEKAINSSLPGSINSDDLYQLLAYSCLGMHQPEEAAMYSRMTKPV